MRVQESVFSKMSGDDELIKRVLVPRFRPMVVPPREWHSFDSVRGFGLVGPYRAEEHR